MRPPTHTKMRSLATLLAAFTAVTALAACDSDEPVTKPLPRGAVDTRDPARTFAPLVWLHRDERHLPIRVEELVDRATLVWEGGDCPDRPRAAGRRLPRAGLPRLRPSDLGGDGFGQAVLNANCNPRRDVGPYPPSAGTRPYNLAYRGTSVPGDQGYYLDLDDSLKRSSGVRPRVRSGRASIAGVPVYVTYRKTTVDAQHALQVVYWLPFGATQPRRVGGGRVPVSHEGGWGRIVVLLRNGRRAGVYFPVSVRYHVDRGRRTEIPWRRVPRVTGPDGGRTHPVAFAALGSHALYASPRNRVRVVRYRGARLRLADETLRCARCPAWRTWEQALEGEAQPWYGFGGAWGATGAGLQSTGPAGPSGFIHDLDY
jgi:hypothetical protein